jgi:hypothetical protein
LGGNANWAITRLFDTGMVPPGTDETITNDQIHDVFIMNTTRNFDLVITPSPEPSTVTLLGVGTLAFLGWSRRQKKRATQHPTDV